MLDLKLAATEKIKLKVIYNICCTFTYVPAPLYIDTA